jgi:hypothetical protein
MLKRLAIYLIIFVLALALFFNYFSAVFISQQNAPDEKGIYQVLADAKADTEN